MALHNSASKSHTNLSRLPTRFDHSCIRSYANGVVAVSVADAVATAILNFLVLPLHLCSCISSYVHRMALFTGLLGFVSTVASLVTYKGGCYDYLPNQIEGVTYDFHLGPSYYCLLFATILKGFDFIFNLIVPVPREGYWDPDRDDSSGGVGSESASSKKQALLGSEISSGDSDGTNGTVQSPIFNT